MATAARNGKAEKLAIERENNGGIQRALQRKTGFRVSDLVGELQEEEFLDVEASIEDESFSYDYGSITNAVHHQYGNLVEGGGRLELNWIERDLPLLLDEEGEALTEEIKIVVSRNVIDPSKRKARCLEEAVSEIEFTIACYPQSIEMKRKKTEVEYDRIDPETYEEKRVSEEVSYWEVKATVDYEGYVE